MLNYLNFALLLFVLTALYIVFLYAKSEPAQENKLPQEESIAKVVQCMIAETETGVLPFINNNSGDGPGQCGESGGQDGGFGPRRASAVCPRVEEQGSSSNLSSGAMGLCSKEVRSAKSLLYFYSTAQRLSQN